MARLTEARRKDIPKSKFALPKSDAYPVDTPGRARAALGFVGMHGTPEQKSAVRAKVKEEYPDIKQSKGPQAAKAKKPNGNGNGNGKSNGNGRNGGNGGANGRLSKELDRRLDARNAERGR